MQPNYVQRLRFQFSKDGPAQYISHLDLARTLERSLNRAQIPVAYTQGFNPRPRMQLASALALGYTSSCEFADIYLTEQVAVEEIQAQMMSRMAPGISITAVWEVAVADPSLQSLTMAAVYHARPLDPFDPAALQARIAALLAATEVLRQRQHKKKIKTYDLRPLIEQLAFDGEVIIMRLTMTATANGRPDELLAELGFDPLDVAVHRAEIILDT